MKTCRKTHRKCTGAELIGKGGGKLECKETIANWWGSSFCVGKNTVDYGWNGM